MPLLLPVAVTTAAVGLVLYYAALHPVKGSVAWYVNRARKAFVHKVLGTSEIERICSGSSADAEMAAALEQCVGRSEQLKDVNLSARQLDAAQVSAQIIRIKRISPTSEAALNLQKCISKTAEVRTLLDTLDVDKHPFTSGRVDHEEYLERLWNGLKPEVRRAGGRVTKEWGEIGFQGDDPATDFRGMGFLGLKQLVYFVEQHKTESQQILADSAQPNWFGLAITGLNLTHDLYLLTTKGRLNPYFHRNGASVESFNRLYAYTFVRFNQAWRQANPPNVMAFRSIHDPFIEELVADLRSATALPIGNKSR